MAQHLASYIATTIEKKIFFVTTKEVAIFFVVASSYILIFLHDLATYYKSTLIFL